jgi:type IV pilus assembly protein PilY1
MDNRGNKWVYFGTGRFMVNEDKTNNDLQSFYGIKEPVDGSGDLTWNQVFATDMLDVSVAEVFDDYSVNNLGAGISNWSDLTNGIDVNNDGWYLDFQGARERNLGQAALLGEILTFTTYQPDDDVCGAAGESNLYALYYKTGTAYHRSVIGTESTGAGEKIKRQVSLGKGLAITPNIHVGEKEGSSAFVQKSTGDIVPIEQANPGAVKSGIITWEPIE